jgi:hypothetical protein
VRAQYNEGPQGQRLDFLGGPSYTALILLLVRLPCPFCHRYVPHSLYTQDKECQTDQCGTEMHFSFHRCIGVNCDKDKDCPKTGRCDSGNENGIGIGIRNRNGNGNRNENQFCIQLWFWFQKWKPVSVLVLVLVSV